MQYTRTQAQNEQLPVQHFDKIRHHCPIIANIHPILYSTAVRQENSANLSLKDLCQRILAACMTAHNISITFFSLCNSAVNHFVRNSIGK